MSKDKVEVLTYIKIKSTLSIKFPQIKEGIEKNPSTSAAIYLDSNVTLKSSEMKGEDSIYEHSFTLPITCFTSVDQINNYINLLLLASLDEKKKVEYSPRDQHIFIDVAVGRGDLISFPVNILEMFKSSDTEVVELASKLFVETYIEYLDKLNKITSGPKYGEVSQEWGKSFGR